MESGEYNEEDGEIRILDTKGFVDTVHLFFGDVFTRCHTTWITFWSNSYRIDYAQHSSIHFDCDTGHRMEKRDCWRNRFHWCWSALHWINDL